MSKVSRLPPASAGEAAARARSRGIGMVMANFTRMSSSPRGRAGSGSGKGLLDLLPKLGERQRSGTAAAHGAGAAQQVEGAQVLAGHLLPQPVVGDRELALRKADDGVAMRHPILRRQEEEHVLLLVDLR